MKKHQEQAIIDNALIETQDKLIETLEAQNKAKSALITEQLALAEGRNARIMELEAELEAAQETIAKQAGELGTLRRLLELDDPDEKNPGTGPG